MPYGRRRYGRTVRPVTPPDPSSVPTFICSHCGKVKIQSEKTVTLTAVKNNSVFLSGRICEDCGKLFQEWASRK